MPTFLYWRHTKTGEIYAVRLNTAKMLDGAYGPIPRTEAILATLPHWPFTAAAGEQLRKRCLEFERIKMKR